MKRSSLLALPAVVLWPIVSMAGAAAEYARPDLVLEPTQLARAEIASQFVILDARPQKDYDHEHVPGARRVDHDAWKAAFAKSEDVAGWSRRIGALGIGPGCKVVVYDNKGVKDAARIWWILKYWGIKDVRLLNGGWKGWKSSGLPTTDAVPAEAPPVHFTATRDRKRLATMKQILALLPRHRLQIVDARSEDEFCGIDLRGNKRGGAIPGAKHLEWSELIDQRTQRFKRPDQLQRLFEQADIDLNRPTASHCNGGGRAAVMAFTLELMGAQDVRNYYRGWGEWGNAEHAPVVVPEKPESPNR